MNKVLAFISVMLLALACTNSQEQEQAETPETPLTQYMDSLKSAYPNYASNVAVAKIICEDFEKRLVKIPGILEDTPFKIVGIAEAGGSISIMLSSDTDINCGSLKVWCDNFDKGQAAQLDKSKSYNITGGTLDHCEHTSGISHEWLDLGSVYINNLELSPAD